MSHKLVKALCREYNVLNVLVLRPENLVVSLVVVTKLKNSNVLRNLDSKLSNLEESRRGDLGKVR